jgi:hypothetical protein
MENTEDSAARHRTLKNIDATQPTFKVGDSILLHNPSTKTGENSKLKIRYEGPIIITEVCPNNNYRLEYLKTSKPLKRLVHGNRIRPLYLHENDYRARIKPPSLFEGPTTNRKMIVQVLFGNLLDSTSDVLVHYVDQYLQPVGEVS